MPVWTLLKTTCRSDCVCVCVLFFSPEFHTTWRSFCSVFSQEGGLQSDDTHAPLFLDTVSQYLLAISHLKHSCAFVVGCFKTKHLKV